MDDSNYHEKKEKINEPKNNQKPLITFAKLNKYFLIPFLCPIFCMLSNYFLGVLISTNIIKRVEFIGIILDIFPYVFAGLFHFISYFKSIEEKEDESDPKGSQNGIHYIYNSNITSIYSHKIFLLIVLLSLLIGINEFIAFINLGKHLFEFRLYFLFFIPLFSKIILKENIYKHQYFSLIVAISGIVLLIIPVCLVFNRDDIVPNILNFIAGIACSLFIVLIKYVIQKYYISPLKLSLVIGIITIILIFLGFIIYSLIKYQDLSYFKDCFDFSEIENKFKISVYFILPLLFGTTQQVLTLFAIFYFSPTLIIVTDIISPMLSWIVNNIQKDHSMPDVVISPIGYLIVLFSSLIYNEFIIFNFCGLSDETKKFVQQRENIEIQELNISERFSGNLQNSDDEISNDS